MPWSLREPILLWVVVELVTGLAMLSDMGVSRAVGLERKRFLTGGYEFIYDLVGFVAALVVARLSLRRLGADWRSLGFTSFRAGRAARYLVAAFIGTTLTVRLVFGLLKFVYPGFDPEQQYLPEVNSAVNAGAWEELLAFLTLVVVGPLTEEVLFRGFLFTTLLRRGVGQAAVYSSLAFALVHVQPNAMVNAFVFGVVYCILFWRLGSLWPAVIFHSLTNWVTIGR